MLPKPKYKYHMHVNFACSRERHDSSIYFPKLGGFHSKGEYLSFNDDNKNANAGSQGTLKGYHLVAINMQYDKNKIYRNL